VESSCEFSIEPSGSIKAGKLSSGLSSSAHLLRVSYILISDLIKLGRMSWAGNIIQMGRRRYWWGNEKERDH
jgi:hypothetical protein